MESDFDEQIALMVIEKYEKYYSELFDNKQVVLDVLSSEKKKFVKTLEKGLREFEKLVDMDTKVINKDIAFKLYDTYGFPIELTLEEADDRGMKVDLDGFYEKFREHQEKSRTEHAI